MNKLIVILLFLNGLPTANAQDNSIDRSQVDSLRKILNKTLPDSTRVFTLLWIGNAYFYSQPDSALHYVQQAYRLAKEIRFTKGEAQSLAMIGNLLFETGNYVKALETQFQVLAIHEKMKNTIDIAACYVNIARIFQAQEDYPNAINYYLKAKDIFEANKRILIAKGKINFLLITFINIGDNYENMNQLDSALFYQNKAYELSLQLKDDENISTILANLGNIHKKLGNFQAALSYYRSSIPVARQANDEQTLANAKYGMATIFQETGKIDSSILLAKESMTYFTEDSYPKGILNASALLSNLYEKQNKMDSAYWFLKKAVNTKDTLFNAEIVRKVQAMDFNEKMRQQVAMQQYRNNLKMYILLSGFIILLLVTVFLVRISHLKREHLIRTQLSKDLHDDLGGTLNSIKVYTNLALIEKVEEEWLQKIKACTQEAITGVRDIIWVLDDRNNNVVDLLARIRQFAISLCEAASIHFNQQINDEVFSIKLQREEKRNLYLIIKEAINNTVKYSNAKEVYLSMKLFNKGKLGIQIKDNGQGFDLAQSSEGNGLKNMRFRAEHIGYSFTLYSSNNQGTTIELKKH